MNLFPRCVQTVFHQQWETFQVIWNTTKTFWTNQKVPLLSWTGGLLLSMKIDIFLWKVFATKLLDHLLGSASRMLDRGHVKRALGSFFSSGNRCETQTGRIFFFSVQKISLTNPREELYPKLSFCWLDFPWLFIKIWLNKSSPFVTRLMREE